MSKKISKYFKVIPKGLNNHEDDFNDSKMSTTDKNPEIRDCFVVLKDVKSEFGKKLKLFDKIVTNKNENSAKQLQKFECDFDGKIFRTRTTLTKHMSVHLPSINCKLCHKILKPQCIKFHLKNFHANEKNFACKICRKAFKAAQYLRQHEKIHNKKFECEICKQKFSALWKLNEHKRNYHENANNFECEICNKKFNSKQNLKLHKKTHEKNRPMPYKCQRCDYATDSKHKINRHQKFHDRQDQKYAAMKNPLKCEKCPTFHRNKNLLRQHMKVVHPKVLFQCDLCAKFIKIKKNLICHMKIHVQKTNSNL